MGKRGNGEGSVYFQASKDRWAAAVTLENGKRQLLYGHTRADVAGKLTKVLSDIHNGLPVTTTRDTVSAFLHQWLETAIHPNREPKTYRSYEQLVRVHIQPALGKVRLAKLTPQQVQKFLNDKSATDLSPRTVQYLHAILRMALNQAMKWGLVGRNVATLVDPPKSRRPKIQPLSGEQPRKLLDSAKDHRHGNMLGVLLATGIRLGEALGTRPERGGGLPVAKRGGVA